MADTIKSDIKATMVPEKKLEKVNLRNKKESERVVKKPEPMIKKRVLTLFLFLMPLMLLAYTPDVFMKIGLFFYEAVILKNFIDDHYLA